MKNITPEVKTALNRAFQDLSSAERGLISKIDWAATGLIKDLGAIHDQIATTMAALKPIVQRANRVGELHEKRVSALGRKTDTLRAYGEAKTALQEANAELAWIADELAEIEQAA